jgi:hypothetical protein
MVGVDWHELSDIVESSNYKAFSTGIKKRFFVSMKDAENYEESKHA